MPACRCLTVHKKTHGSHWEADAVGILFFQEKLNGLEVRFGKGHRNDVYGHIKELHLVRFRDGQVLTVKMALIKTGKLRYILDLQQQDRDRTAQSEG